MIFKHHSQQATASIGEYLLTFTIVIALVAGISTYFKRALQARMRDSRQYVFTNIREQCLATNCVGKGDIGDGYEPYYAYINSEISSNKVSHKGVVATNRGGDFFERSRSNNQSETLSQQLPPRNAANDEVLGGH